MPAVPPSYDQAMSSGAGLPYPPQQGQSMYPPLPQEKGGMPPAHYQPPAGYPGAGAPPPAGPPPGQPTVITQVQYVQGPTFGYRPVKMTCPHCQSSITTRTDEESSALAWIICGACCLFGFWPCACLPFCMDSLKSVSRNLKLYFLSLSTLNIHKMFNKMDVF